MFRGVDISAGGFGPRSPVHRGAFREPMEGRHVVYAPPLPAKAYALRDRQFRSMSSGCRRVEAARIG